jgi:hypothetical protein
MKSNVKISFSRQFTKDYKRLKKRYNSLDTDLAHFFTLLKENPLQGTDLGMNVRKIRLAISSKHKGKSGGARVISYTALLKCEEGEIRLLTIYDKSDRESISDKEIRQIMSEEGLY